MQNVFVYFNLHTKKWSVRALEGAHKGKVIGHALAVCLLNVTPSVNARGRDRVRATGQKEVHAGLVGQLVFAYEWQSYKGRFSSIWEQKPDPDYKWLYEITYNPYKYDSFVFKSNLSNFRFSKMALLNTDRRVYVLID